MPLPDALQSALKGLRSIPLADWSWAIGILALSGLVGAIAGRFLAKLVRRVVRQTESTLDDAIIDGVGPPIRWLLPVLAIRLSLPLSPLPEEGLAAVGRACTIALLSLLGWGLWRATAVAEQVVQARFDTSVADNLQARSVQTQVRGFRNIARFAIALLTVGLISMTFEPIRRLGVSLLASAGVAGIVIGFAAQRSIATVVAGIQIALSQPIRVDDVVIVEGEWGRIEEITLTYVVVKIWDERRLVVPITSFIEKPFQNWTRTSSELLGTIFLYVDYRLPLAPLRAELKRLVEADERWDGRVQQIVVTDAMEHALQLRGLVSARNAGSLWDLRCAVREGLVDFIQREYPECLPRLRATLSEPESADGP